MKAFKTLFLMINGKPYNTKELVSRKNFIIRKHDKVNYKLREDYIEYMQQISKYGNIIDPVIVSKESFSKKYVIRGNCAAYFALVANNMSNVPVVFMN